MKGLEVRTLTGVAGVLGLRQLPIGEHEIKRMDLTGQPGKSVYVQEQTTYQRPVLVPEHFATGQVYGAIQV